jgi:hypothetical protein
MRICAVQSQLLLLLALSAPALAHAQFQQPTPEELSMTADPKAPGAAAVYLNVAEVTNAPLNFQSFYARIKVLKEKGEELATVELPYRKDEYQYEVAAIQGRTIHPDGTVVLLTGKPADLLTTKSQGTEFRHKVFILPQVGVGSIIEYYYQLRCNADYYFPPPDWEVQHAYFVHKAHYSFSPDRETEVMSFVSLLPPGVSLKKEALGRYSLDLADIPAAPDEEWMPPIESTLFRVVFHFNVSDELTDYWQRQGAKWSRAVDAFAEPSQYFRADVNGLIAPGDSNLEKARKLYKAVQILENTDFSREKTEAERKALKLKAVKRAEDVWRQKSGASSEIALLYLSMLRAAGLTAYAMRVVDRDKGSFNLTYYSLDQFDDTIVLLSVDGKEIVLDPGEKMCPFQTVYWTHSTTTGLRQTAGGTAIVISPRQEYSANTFTRIADITLDSHGAIDGNLRFLMSGQEALYWRQKALENDEAEVKKQFDEWIENMVPDGVAVHIDHFIALDDPDSKLAAVIKAQGAAGTATSKRLLVPGLFFETRSSHPFVDQDKRLTPVDMQYGDEITDDVTYNLPPGLEVESAPEAMKIPWEGHAVLVIKSQTASGQVTITRTLARSFTLASTTEYQDLRAFYQKVAAADQQQLVLTASTVAKGN